MSDSSERKLQPFADEHTESCGCSHDHDHGEHDHDHHHEHGESCGCGHDHDHGEHEHDHHHEHGESCGCGHDHVHEEHDHDHEESSREKAVFLLENLGCAHCASRMEEKIRQLPGVNSASIIFATKQLRLDAEHPMELLPQIQSVCASVESQVKVVPREERTGRSGQIRTYVLENLGCAHCASKMEEQIGQLQGMEEAVITFATKQLRITAQNPDRYLPEIRRICTSIESQVQVKEKEVPGRESLTKAQEKEDGRGVKGLSGEKKELLCILLGAVLFVIGEVLEHTGAGEGILLGVLVIGYLILGGKILLNAARNICRGQIFDENFLMSIATLGAFAIREYPEAVGVMLFYRIGEYFQDKAVERSRGQIMDAMDLRPEVVNLLQGEELQVIPASQARIGDLLLIRPGDRIPLDGVIVEGESRLDTSPITGEPVPVAVRMGDAVTSGCMNTSGQLKMRVEKPLEESMVTRILDSVENAAASKPKIDRFITRFSRVYTPIVVCLALLVAIVPSLMGGDWYYWVYTACSFLVMSCPCALVLSVPLAFFSGIGAGSKRGILFKGGVSMEALGKLKAVVMDKTGTVTEGNFRLQQVVPAGSFSEEELLSICAGCEQNSTHPIAHSIVAAAREKNLEFAALKSLEEIAGQGIAAQLSTGEVLCGNRKLMEAHGITGVPEKETYGAEVFVAVNGVFAGYLLISDTIKADAREAVSRLKSMGLQTVMLTGDSRDSAQAVARETGIDQVYARLMPQEKLEILQKVRSESGTVMFVGDGINDAPVLAGADVGAAMGSGADAAIEAADAVFMTSSVSSIPEAVEIARSTNRIAIQNVVFALAVKIVVILLGLTGHANMWLAVFADTGVAMLCVLNSIRMLYRK